VSVSPRSIGWSAWTGSGVPRQRLEEAVRKRVDRHEHIGEGCLGLEPFRRILNDRRFAALPLLIETEKSKGGDRPGTIVPDPLDMKNLETLRRLRRRRAL